MLREESNVVSTDPASGKLVGLLILRSLICVQLYISTIHCILNQEIVRLLKKLGLQASFGCFFLIGPSLPELFVRQISAAQDDLATIYERSGIERGKGSIK